MINSTGTLVHFGAGIPAISALVKVNNSYNMLSLYLSLSLSLCLLRVRM